MKKGNRKKLKDTKKESLLKNANTRHAAKKLIRQENTIHMTYIIFSKEKTKGLRQEQAHINQGRYRTNNPCPQKNNQNYIYLYKQGQFGHAHLALNLEKNVKVAIAG